MAARSSLTAKVLVRSPVVTRQSSGPLAEGAAPDVIELPDSCLQNMDRQKVLGPEPPGRRISVREVKVLPEQGQPAGIGRVQNVRVSQVPERGEPDPTVIISGVPRAQVIPHVGPKGRSTRQAPVRQVRDGSRSQDDCAHPESRSAHQSTLWVDGLWSRPIVARDSDGDSDEDSETPNRVTPIAPANDQRMAPRRDTCVLFCCGTCW